MEELLKKANELGLMIRESDIRIKFDKISNELDLNVESKQILDRYTELAEDIHVREGSGVDVEKFEKEELKGLAQKIQNNEVILNYIGVRDEYVDFLIQIQKSVEIIGDAGL